MSIRARLAANMIQIRKTKGWSQEELAEQAGLHRTYISGLERQIRNPTIDVLEKVAAALGISAGALLDQEIGAPW